MTRPRVTIVCVLVALPLALLLARTGKPRPPTAAEEYALAARQLSAECPSSSSMEPANFPPYGDEWDVLAAAAWEQNAGARAAARVAGTAEIAGWPATVDDDLLLKCRLVANDLADAAVYRALGSDVATSLGLLNDLLDLTGKLRAEPNGSRYGTRFLVAIGIEAMAAQRVIATAPEVAAAQDASEADVRRLIARLLDVPDPAAAFEALRTEGFHVGGVFKPGPATADDLGLMRSSSDRVVAERRMAAISLACQLFRRDCKAWPATADDLVPAYLAALPVDPADGKSPLGYVLVKGGLPDGGDRPMVYSRLESRDRLAYRTDEPQYAFYAWDGSTRPSRENEKAGQFRDVARWVPAGPIERTDKPTLRLLDGVAP